MATKSYAIDAVISAVDKFSDPLDKIAGKALGDISKKMTNIGKGLTAAVTLPVVGLGIAAVSSAVKFNQGMANIATLIPGNKQRIGELGDSVMDLAEETGKSTDDLTGGLYEVISAFGDTANSVDILSVAAKSAVAGVSSTEESIKLLSAVTKAWDNTTTEAVQKAADLSFLSVKLGQTNFPELAASIGKVTGFSQLLGVSQEEMFAVMATATGVTGGAAEVSTQFKAALQGLMNPSKGMTALLQGMGIESGKALIEQRGLSGALKLVADTAEATKRPMAEFLGSSEAQQLVFALTGAQAGKYAETLTAMEKAQGAATESYKAQTEGVNSLGQEINELMAKVSNISIRLGQALIPALSRVMTIISPGIDMIGDLAKKFQTLDPTMQTSVVVVGGLAAALGPVLIVVGALIPIIGALSLPVLAAVGAVASLAMVGLTLYNNWEDIKLLFSDTWDSIAGNFQANVENITRSIDNIMQKWEGLKSGIKAVGNFFGLGAGEEPAAVRQVAKATTAPAVKAVTQATATAQPGTAQSVAATGVQAAPATALSALPNQPINQARGKLEVEFKNAPPGTWIKDKTEDKGFLDMTTDLGTSLLNWATGG